MSTISIILLSSIGIRFYSDLWQVDGFLRVLRFPPPIKLTPRYNWNIVESGVITSSSKQTNKSINRYNQHLFTDDWRSKCGISKQRSNLKTNILCYPEMAKSSKPLSKRVVPIFFYVSSFSFALWCCRFLPFALCQSWTRRLFLIKQKKHCIYLYCTVNPLIAW